MLKVRDLTESLEKKYNLDEDGPTLDELPFDEIMNKESTEGNMNWYEEDHPTWKRYKKEVDEAYEYEIDDELDYIMDDNSLSDIEREQAISNLYSKYNLHESNSCDGWIAFYNGKKLEIPKSDVDGGIYEAKQKAIKELKVPKSKIGLLSIKPAYNESLNESIDIDYSEGELFSDDLSNLDWYSFWDEDYYRTWYAAKDRNGRFEATIWPAVDGYDIYVEIDNKPFYDHRRSFRDTDQAIRFVDEIFMEEIFIKEAEYDESLKESFFEPTEWFDDFVDNYETHTPEEWNNWDQERRDAEVMKSMKLFLMDNPLSEDEAKEFMDDLEDNNFHTAARALAKLCNL